MCCITHIMTVDKTKSQRVLQSVRVARIVANVEREREVRYVLLDLLFCFVFQTITGGRSFAIGIISNKHELTKRRRSIRDVDARDL